MFIEKCSHSSKGKQNTECLQFAGYISFIKLIDLKAQKTKK